MALTPEQRAAIQTAYDEAVAAVNIPNGPVVYNNCPENVSILTKFLLSEGVLQDRWASSFIWQSAILHCRQNAMLIEPPVKKSREQREAELHAQDRAAGKATRFTSKGFQSQQPAATAEELAAARAEFQEVLDPVTANRRRAEEKALQQVAAAAEQRQMMSLFPDVSQEFADYSPEQHAAFRKLTPANMRLLGAKRDDWKRQQAQERAAARKQ
jgi:hypothetical protein